MVHNPHSLPDIPHVEYGHIEDSGDNEEDEDHERENYADHMPCHQMRCLTELARVRGFDTEAIMVDIHETLQHWLKRTERDKVVHQSSHVHVEKVGIGQDLGVDTF